MAHYTISPFVKDGVKGMGSNIMAIETTQEYQKQEARLQEIKNTLEVLAKKDDVELSEVVTLREEARTLAKSLKAYLKTTFDTKN